MQIRALIYFDELVRTNSMRHAAENLNVAPTAISRQIENLEYHFGTPLVERSARGIKLTLPANCWRNAPDGRCASSIMFTS